MKTPAIMDEQSAISRIRDVALCNVPNGGKAILFGSRARGDNTPMSDWDILILVDKDVLRQVDYDTISYPFVLLGCDINETINPILYTMKEWENYKITPFYENVMRDGINLI